MGQCGVSGRQTSTAGPSRGRMFRKASSTSTPTPKLEREPTELERRAWNVVVPLAHHPDLEAYADAFLHHPVVFGDLLPTFRVDDHMRGFTTTIMALSQALLYDQLLRAWTWLLATPPMSAKDEAEITATLVRIVRQSVTVAMQASIQPTIHSRENPESPHSCAVHTPPPKATVNLYFKTLVTDA